MESMPNLLALARHGIGVDNIDIEAATSMGIVVINHPDYGLDEVADHAIALSLALTRRIVRLDRMMRERRSGQAIKETVEPIHANSSLTFGLLGLGNIARRVATRARAFGFKVVSYDPWVPRAEFGLIGVERVSSLGELLEVSDVISVHVPLNPQTRHMLGEKELARMKKSALIVNTSRGPVIDQDAMYRALSNGRLAGAGLDVYEVEPLPANDPLRELENVILTPHMAGYSVESENRLRTDISYAVLDVLNGRRPELIFNPKVWERRRNP
jgi:D-3-phosphoglycerate dehydrogenase